MVIIVEQHSHRERHGRLPDDDDDHELHVVHERIREQNILKSVNVAKGAVVTETDAQDFSCYRSFMSATSQTYYFATYNNQRVRKIDLQALTSLTKPKIFVVDNHEDILNITND